jgi:hypothetical protein
VARFEPRTGGLSIAFRSPIKMDAVVTLSMPGAVELRATGGPDGRPEVRITRLTTTVYRLEFELDRAVDIELEWSEAPGAVGH